MKIEKKTGWFVECNHEHMPFETEGEASEHANNHVRVTEDDYYLCPTCNNFYWFLEDAKHCCGKELEGER